MNQNIVKFKLLNLFEKLSVGALRLVPLFFSIDAMRGACPAVLTKTAISDLPIRHRAPQWGQRDRLLGPFAQNLSAMRLIQRR